MKSFARSTSLILCSMMLLSVQACSKTAPSASVATLSPSPSPSLSPSPSPSPTQDPVLAKVNAMIANMTIGEKVGQLLFIAYRKDASGAGVTARDAQLDYLLTTFNPGGFVLFSENISSIPQTTALISSLQNASKIPMFISADEEGGIVSRLNSAPALHSTVMPPAFTIGRTGNSQNAFDAAAAQAAELRSLGFNMDFAPVADIFSNPANTVIASRAYGTEPALVSLMVAQAVRGYGSRNIISVLKHFPGHGDTTEDTHTGAAIVQHDLQRLLSFELVPFKAGIDAGAGAVMAAHILLPNYQTGSTPLPASLSREVITGLLRERLGFDGVVMTDALEMKAVASYFGTADAAAMVIGAGGDMLLMPGSVEEAYFSILAAVNRGDLTEKRIDESVRRILLLKERFGILDRAAYEASRPDPETTLGSAAHQAVAARILSEAK